MSQLVLMITDQQVLFQANPYLLDSLNWKILQLVLIDRERKSLREIRLYPTRPTRVGCFANLDFDVENQNGRFLASQMGLVRCNLTCHQNCVIFNVPSLYFFNLRQGTEGAMITYG